MADSNGARTHEPSLRELTGQLDDLKELMMEKFKGMDKFLEANDRRYEDRFASMDEKTTLALASSEKAVVKAESATEKRFDAMNEFRATLSDQAATLMPRAESLALHKAAEEKQASLKEGFDKIVDNIQEQIVSLRESRSEGGGKEKAVQQSQQQVHWSTGLLVSILLSVPAWVALAIVLIRGVK